jgi:hypothetical protein
MNALVLTLSLLGPSQPPPVPIPAQPPPVIVETPHPVVVPAPAAITVEEFAKAFVPVPGVHKVTLIHPKSCKPVEVCFTLPDCGCPKVRYNRHHLEFDYGKHWTDIRFRFTGAVDVKTR